MTGLSLHIDRVVIQTDVEREAAARIPAILRAAYLLLAQRWQRSPWSRRVALDVVVRARLEVAPLSSDELLGERGADLLADAMWTAFVATLEAPT